MAAAFIWATTWWRLYSIKSHRDKQVTARNRIRLFRRWWRTPIHRVHCISLDTKKPIDKYVPQARECGQRCALRNKIERITSHSCVSIHRWIDWIRFGGCATSIDWIMNSFAVFRIIYNSIFPATNAGVCQVARSLNFGWIDRVARTVFSYLNDFCSINGHVIIADKYMSRQPWNNL